MDQASNERQDQYLRRLLERYARDVQIQEVGFYSEEDYDTLLAHFYATHDYDTTLALADQAIAQHSYCPDFYKWKALIHKINLEEDEALATLERLMFYAPNDEEALVLRLEVLIHFEQVDDARELHTKLEGRLTGKPKRSLLAFFDGLLLLQEFETRKAWSAFVNAFRLDPRQEPALDELLNAPEFGYLREDLERQLRRAVEHDPFNHLVWYYLGLWYDDNSQDEKALDAFSNARALDDQDLRYELDYADKLFDLEDYERALATYAIYLAHPEAQENYETYMRLGRCHQLLGQLTPAKEAFFAAVRLEPEMYDIYQHLGECFAAEERWGMAAYNYGRAVEQPNHTATCWLGLALCQAATNETEDAERAFRKAIAMDDGYSDAFVSYAIFLADHGREQEARGALVSALDRYEDASLLYGMVAVCLMTSRRQAALRYLNEALSRYYDDQELLTEWYPNLRDDREINAIFELYRP